MATVAPLQVPETKKSPALEPLMETEVTWRSAVPELVTALEE